ncbi:MAG: HEAT repeat domain-containing protein [Bacteroidota bacterium]
MKTFWGLLAVAAMSVACSPPSAEVQVTRLDPADAAAQAEVILNDVAVTVADGLELALWAPDSLSPDPIALEMDALGRAYITRTNRQKNSEFDIRGYPHWEIASISWQTVDDRRAFLREQFAPARSAENTALADLNGDGSHDWRDLTVEQEEVYRIEDSDGDGVADTAIRLLADFNELAGDVAGATLPVGDDVYVGVAPNVWRFTDTDGDGIPDEKTSISEGYGIHIGFNGHSVSGLIHGPDGRIYWSVGDIGFSVTAPDGTLHHYPNQGGIFRSERDGSNFEVFAAGLRNPHEFVFDDYGNIITVDNDGDHAGEKERLAYIVEGSDSGWRTNWQFGKYRDPDNNTYKVWMDEGLYLPRFEGQAAYITPPLMNYHSGPTGMAYNPGTALGETWNKHFFVSAFVGNASGTRIHGFTLDPDGAGFALKNERVLTRGILATGIDFGPDGALYVADWITGWRTKDYGRIWKLDDPSEAGSSVRQETEALIRADFSGHEAAHLAALLRHTDRRIRQKAQFELAGRGAESARTLRDAATQTDHHLARMHGLWGLGQLERAGIPTMADVAPLLKDADDEVRAQAAKLIGDVRYAQAAPRLVEMLADEAPRVQFFAAEALGRIEHAPAIDALIALLDANDDSDTYLRHAGALALARIGEVGPVAALAEHPSAAVRLAAVVALRRMQAPEVARFLNDADVHVMAEAARAINDDWSIEAALPALATVLKRPGLTNEPLLRRAISANLRIGGQDAANRLAEYSVRADAPEELRVDAIAALGTWTKPSVLDRVTGRWRGERVQDTTQATVALARVASRLLTQGTPMLKVATANAVARLRYAPSYPTLARLVDGDPAPEVRQAALGALAQVDYAELEVAVERGLADSNVDVRMTALSMVPTMALDDDRKTGLLASVLGTRSIAEQQSALAALGNLDAPAAHGVLETQFASLQTDALPRALHLDLMEAIDASTAAMAQTQLAAYRAAREGQPDAIAYSEVLYGGDPAAGSQVFYNNSAAQCVRCHVGENWGGDVGPNLSNIADVLSREQLLAALIAPSDRIAPGYGVTTLTLTDGASVTGTLQEEGADFVVIQASNAEPTRYDASEIEARQDAPSSMPSQRSLLSRRELRDLMAYLADRTAGRSSDAEQASGHGE